MIEDVRPDEADRYAIVVLVGKEARRQERRRLAYTSRDGIGVCLATLREDGDLHVNDRVGIYDRLDRGWLVNPYGEPRPERGTSDE